MRGVRVGQFGPLVKDIEVEAGHAVDLFGMEESEALDIVTGCLNKKLLTEWQDTDTRMKLQRTIQEQLDKLKLKHKKD